MLSMMKIILVTAVTSSAAHIMFGAPSTCLLGASGIVFMQILLCSLIEAEVGRVPLTFIVQCAVWCYKEIALCFFKSVDGVSHIAHVSGAFCGVVAGYYYVNSSEYKKRKDFLSLLMSSQKAVLKSE